jgi:molybdate transport system substrate-binding protein
VRLALNVGWAKRSVPTNSIATRKRCAWARRFRAFAHPTIFVLALTAQPSLAADIQVYSSGAPAQVAQSLAARFLAATGHRVVLTSATIGEMRRKLAAGDRPDAIILPAPTIAALDKAGSLLAGSRIDLARVGVGVAVRAGAALPDISTPDALRKVLVDARSIVHSDPAGGGFAGAQIARMMTQLGIADVVEPKTSLKSAIAGGTAAVANGVAEIGLFNISEILIDKGVALVGPLPQELQSWIVFAGAVHAASAEPDAARAFLRSLAAPDARDAWTKGGLEPL